MKIDIESIGTIFTEFKDRENMPVQPCGGDKSIGKIVIKDEYKQGLKDLDGFSHIYLIYYFHKSKDYKLEVIPFNDKTNSKRGVFSTRTPIHLHTPEQFGQPADLHPDTLPELIRTASRFIFGQF